MDSLNLIVMGKTGAGKSTLINAVLGEDLAPTGLGQTVTKENQLYTKQISLPLCESRPGNGSYSMVRKTLNLYDTVGLEIDKNITQKTLHKTKDFIRTAQSNERANDLTMVWFCVNCRSNRFEPFEFDLIKSLSIEHEIPFVLVLTQCYSDEQGELERQIRQDFQEIPVMRVLAKDYILRGMTVSAYGTTELLKSSILDYNHRKVNILESKLLKLSEERKARISKIKSEGISCIESYSTKAERIGYFPGGCVPFVFRLCQNMIRDLNRNVGLDSTKEFAADIFTNTVVGIIAMPFMFVPFLSAGVAKSYVETVGESYLDSLMAVIEYSSDEELRNNTLMAKRIQVELNKRKK